MFIPFSSIFLSFLLLFYLYFSTSTYDFFLQYSVHPPFLFFIHCFIIFQTFSSHIRILPLCLFLIISSCGYFIFPSIIPFTSTSNFSHSFMPNSVQISSLSSKISHPPFVLTFSASSFLYVYSSPTHIGSFPVLFLCLLHCLPYFLLRCLFLLFPLFELLFLLKCLLLLFLPSTAISSSTDYSILPSVLPASSSCPLFSLTAPFFFLQCSLLLPPVLPSSPSSGPLFSIQYSLLFPSVLSSSPSTSPLFSLKFFPLLPQVFPSSPSRDCSPLRLVH